MIGFKTSDCKKEKIGEKSTFIITQQRLRHKTGLHVVGFGAPAKSHFHASALRHVWAFLLLAAVVEVAVALLIHGTIS